MWRFPMSEIPGLPADVFWQDAETNAPSKVIPAETETEKQT